MSSEVEKAQER